MHKMPKSRLAISSLVFFLGGFFINIYGGIICSQKTREVVAFEKKIVTLENQIQLEKTKQIEIGSIGQLLGQASNQGFNEPLMVVYADNFKKVASLR
jgi:hypothetical protein